MKRLIFQAIAVPAAAALAAASATAQVSFSSLSGSPYAQDFSSLASSGTVSWSDNLTLPGWYASTNSSSGPLLTYKASTGTDMSGGVYSFGSSGAGDRALGSIGSNSSGPVAYGVRFMNDTSMTITNITVAYTGEQWRNGGNTTVQTLAFSYRISSSPITSADSGNSGTWTAVAALDFATPVASSTAGALDGNAAGNRTPISAVLLVGASVPPGWEIFLRWRDINDSGNDHAVAIDDLAVGYTSVVVDTTPPGISSSGQPYSRTNNAGTIATFTVTPSQGSGITYQWRKDGYNLSDGGKFYQTDAPSLTVSNVFASEAGSYDVVLANGNGWATSSVAVLTVLDPAVNTPPVSRTNMAGDTANFSVSVAGTPFLYYQWRFAGQDIDGATEKTLAVADVQADKAGAYDFVLIGAEGSVTSAPAYLSLLATPSTRIARWDFNDTNTLSSSAPVSAVGSGTAALVNGTRGSFSGGTSSDPAGGAGPANSAWTTTTYGPPSTPNKSSGVQFNVSTVGYKNILLSWEQRHSDAASKYMRLQYTMDGTTFVDADALTMLVTNNTFVPYTSDLSGVPGINNNPAFAFRIVSEWESTATGDATDNYVGTVSSYDTGGTIRFDLITVIGDPADSVSPVPLSVQREGTNVVLTWNDPSFGLQAAPSAIGEYTNVPGATSPFTNLIAGPQQFFRLKHPTP